MFIQSFEASSLKEMRKHSNVWTLRNEPAFLSPTYDGDAAAEYRQYRDLGVDGMFTDFADTAARALR